jgi:hypothetical protein
LLLSWFDSVLSGSTLNPRVKLKLILLSQSIESLKPGIDIEVCPWIKVVESIDYDPPYYTITPGDGPAFKIESLNVRFEEVNVARVEEDDVAVYATFKILLNPWPEPEICYIALEEGEAFEKLLEDYVKGELPGRGDVRGGVEAGYSKAVSTSYKRKRLNINIGDPLKEAIIRVAARESPMLSECNEVKAVKSIEFVLSTIPYYRVTFNDNSTLELKPWDVTLGEEEVVNEEDPAKPLCFKLKTLTTKTNPKTCYVTLEEGEAFEECLEEPPT